MNIDSTTLFAFAQFFQYLESEQVSPEYLGEPPESVNVYDTYQTVAEWTALRHEVKQQGKLLRIAQDKLDQALSATLSDREQAQKNLEESQKQITDQFEHQQEKLLRDLLGIVDALDRACTYWQEEITPSPTTTTLPRSTPQKTFWKILREWFIAEEPEVPQPEISEKPTVNTAINEILTSHLEGIQLIKKSFLELLRSRKVVPIEALGKPFDPQKMYAIGREKSADKSENTVIQEVVTGYLWGNRVLREAQVIVALPYSKSEEFLSEGK
jgi:molecular chaperone GrpE